LRGFGVTTVHTGHGPGALVSGQTLVAKTVGNTADAAVIVPRAMVAANLGPAALADGGKAPGTRAKQIAMLRAALIAAKEGDAPKPAKKGEEKSGAEKPPSLEVQTMLGLTDELEAFFKACGFERAQVGVFRFK
jgi:hypothetical protein